MWKSSNFLNERFVVVLLYLIKLINWKYNCYKYKLIFINSYLYLFDEAEQCKSIWKNLTVDIFSHITTLSSKLNFHMIISYDITSLL